MKVTRPAFRYFGGKWNLALWIIAHFPDHDFYVEPCGGAASVLLQKPRAGIMETYNDINDIITNFFLVLRDKPDKLINKINLTPWSRREYELCREIAGDDVERARRWWVVTQMSINGIGDGSGMRMYNKADTVPGGARTLFNGDLSHLRAAAQRFKEVQIENRDMFQVIEHFNGPDTLVYFDPPYVHSSRSSGTKYKHEFDNDMHVRAADALKRLDSYVVISGYDNPLYCDLYERAGWTTVNKKAKTNNGQNKLETLWLSPRTADAVLYQKQLSFEDI